MKRGCPSSEQQLFAILRTRELDKLNVRFFKSLYKRKTKITRWRTGRQAGDCYRQRSILTPLRGGKLPRKWWGSNVANLPSHLFIPPRFIWISHKSFSRQSSMEPIVRWRRCFYFPSAQRQINNGKLVWSFVRTVECRLSSLIDPQTIIAMKTLNVRAINDRKRI